MGVFVNPGYGKLQRAKNNKFYIDKSLLISTLNGKIGSEDCFVCVSRPRRFGKTMAANMLAAYYSKGCDSHEIFSDLKIKDDPSFGKHINRYTVIKIDMNDIVTGKGTLSIPDYISLCVVEELKEVFPSVELKSESSLASAIRSIWNKTGEQFVIIIDEYDVVIRDDQYEAELSGYLSFLVSLFKGEATSSAIVLAYITGIMPVIREKTQSKLNNFTEYTMLDADEMAPFMGFSEEETRELASETGMDFEELKRWYDGYTLEGMDIYSPKSVITAAMKNKCSDYWTQTGSYDVLKDQILINYDGMRDDIVLMISGSGVSVNPNKFRNTPRGMRSRDEVFTYLIHLGYLGFDSERSECFIPNHELRSEWILAIEDSPDYRPVINRINASRQLLSATWNMDEKAVAEGVGKTHMEVTSNLTYNNEGAFQSALALAYLYADSFYTVVRELPAGKGYADIAFIPYVPGIPAMIVELKRNDSAEAAIGQIKRKEYPKALEKYAGNILLVGISYDTETKHHSCIIEKA